MPARPAHRRFPTPAVVLLAGLASGCGGDGARARPESAPGTPFRSDKAAPVGGAAAADTAAGPAAPLSAAAPTAASAAASPAADSAASTAAAAMLIRTGTASVEVDSVEQAVAQLRALAARLGGYVANATLAGGTEQARSATLELKVPAARFDALTAGLRPLGRVESVDVKAEDVGEEYVDVGAQLANGRRLEARLTALADRQSSRLADLLAVERELARVRGEIDRAEGRLRYLRAHAATSTLAVTVHAPETLVGGSPATNPIAAAFRDAWRVFVNLVAVLITSLGVLVPLGAAAAAVWYGRRRWARARGAPPRDPPYGPNTAYAGGDAAPPAPPNLPRTT